MPPEESSFLPRPPRLFYNWISLAGAVFTVGSVFAFFLLFGIEAFLPHSNPYVGLLVYLIAPLCFFAGIALILAGFLLATRGASAVRAMPLALGRSGKA